MYVFSPRFVHCFVEANAFTCSCRCDSVKYRTPNFFNAKEEKKANTSRRRTRTTRATKGDEEEGTPAASGAGDDPNEREHEFGDMSTISNMDGNTDMETMQDPDAVDALFKQMIGDKNKDAAAVATAEQHAPPSPASSGGQPNGEPQLQSTEQPQQAEVAPVPNANRKRARPAEQAETLDKEWDSFEYESLPWDAKTDDFTVDACKRIEKRYWQSLTFGAPPMYGADGKGSLFDDSTKDWNVAALDDLLMRINPHMPMPGVNTPYLYFGMWRATCTFTSLLKSAGAVC